MYSVECRALQATDGEPPTPMPPQLPDATSGDLQSFE